MNRAGLFVLLGAVGLSLSGCGMSMRNYLEKETPTDNLAVRQDLTMPPDLRLPPPGTTAAAPDAGAVSAPAVSAQTASLTTPPSTAPVYKAPAATKASAPATTAAATSPAVSGPDAVYVNAGISLYNPDGTKKTQQQLNSELQAYYVAQKKAKNPTYGTVFNMGNIFKDE
jgi:hypothetical protein